MKEPTKGELIEIIAAVSFRVLAFTYAFGAITQFVGGLLNLISAGYPTSFHTPQVMVMVAMVFLLNVFPSVIFYRLAVPFARVAARGPSEALEMNPQA